MLTTQSPSSLLVKYLKSWFFYLSRRTNYALFRNLKPVMPDRLLGVQYLTPMKKISLLLTVVLGTALAILSCKKDHNDHYTMSNQDFVNQASSSNMFEIAAGNLALHNSTNANVNAFGNHM